MRNIYNSDISSPSNMHSLMIHGAIIWHIHEISDADLFLKNAVP